MPSTQKILGTLSRMVLLDVAREFEVAGLTGKSKSEIIGALSRTRRVSARAVLGLLSREELKSLCQGLGLDDKGREKS